MPGPDWIFHPLGALLALAGGLWLLWALFLSGRARGKPRCPRCWYDMTGAQGLTCPECGKTPKSPKGLLKTRRKYLQALASLLVLLLAYSAWEVPRIKRYGWPCALPNWALIAVYAVIGSRESTDFRTPLNMELSRRLDCGRCLWLDRFAVSFFVGHWMDDASQRYPALNAVILLASARQANSTEIERLVILERDSPDPWIRTRALVALARAAVCDPRVQARLTERLFGRKNRDPNLFNVLEHTPRLEAERDAWLRLVTRGLCDDDWATPWHNASVIARIGPHASDLLPILEKVLVDANDSKVPFLNRAPIEWAIAMVRGECASDAEYWSGKLTEPAPVDRRAAACIMQTVGGPLTPTAVANLKRALETETDDAALAEMCAVAANLEGDCHSLLPVIRDISTRLTPNSNSERSARRAISVLEYPW